METSPASLERPAQRIETGMRILVVEDDPINQQMVQFTLEECGHEVVTANNGKDALDLFHKEPYRLIITDWNMPEMDGVTLCREIRKAQVSGYVYIILLTGNRDSEHTVEGLNAGADDFIPKPFDPEELVVRVRAGERVLGLETRDLLINALAKLAESRDEDTGMHIERVRSYSKILARYMHENSVYPEADAGFVQLVFDTSPLHDIGKVAIPDAVLKKPGKLTDEEFDLMKTHTTVGGNTLDAILKERPEVKFLQIARDIAATHHEKWNGKGYPYGLKGEEIPLCGRIVAVADVYDALTTKRVYKDAFPHEKARDILTGDAGTHFDPLAIEAFLAMEKAVVHTRENLQDE